MFSSSGRDTSSWVHTEGREKGVQSAPAWPLPRSSPASPGQPALPAQEEEETQAGGVLARCQA